MNVKLVICGVCNDGCECTGDMPGCGHFGCYSRNAVTATCPGAEYTGRALALLERFTALRREVANARADLARYSAQPSVASVLDREDASVWASL